MEAAPLKSSVKSIWFLFAMVLGVGFIAHEIISKGGEDRRFYIGSFDHFARQNVILMESQRPHLHHHQVIVPTIHLMVFLMMGY